MSAQRSAGSTWRDTVTASFVILACGATIIAAGSVALQEAAAVATRRAIVENGGALDEPARQAARAAAVGRAGWSLVPGRLDSLVLDIDLAAAKPDPRLIEDDLMQILARKPAHGPSWQSLAQIRMVNGLSAREALPLVRTSAMLSPHDGHVMVPRVVFGIQNWSDIDEEDRNRTIRELDGVVRIPTVTFQASLLAEVLGEQPEETRRAVRARLMETGLPRESMKRLGL